MPSAPGCGKHFWRQGAKSRQKVDAATAKVCDFLQKSAALLCKAQKYLPQRLLQIFAKFAKIANFRHTAVPKIAKSASAFCAIARCAMRFARALFGVFCNFFAKNLQNCIASRLKSHALVVPDSPRLFAIFGFKKSKNRQKVSESLGFLTPDSRHLFGQKRVDSRPRPQKALSAFKRKSAKFCAFKAYSVYAVRFWRFFLRKRKKRRGA